MAVREGRRRVVIEGVTPEIDCGAFPVKRVAGEAVVVEADIFADGHDLLAAELGWKRDDEPNWHETRMAFVENDRWRGHFQVGRPGRYLYTLRAWVDRFGTWRRDFKRRVDAGQDVSMEALIGVEMIERAARRAAGPDGRNLRDWAGELRRHPTEWLAEEDVLLELMERYPDRRFGVRYERELAVTVDRERARFSSWYELFPRSYAAEPGHHGTFAELEKHLPHVAEMGFDVLYLPPIHPIGLTHRKGRNNSTVAKREDPGSPWAIGASDGGHTAIHAELGTLEDFDRLLGAARDQGLEIALDLAYQCSPDHPWVTEHPGWFRHRPDGTVQYAENPPKKYEDILPINFETDDWRALWDELRAVVDFWIGQGVRIFRVDNPHTKSFRFWEWLIGEVTAEHPDVIFLAEAFTRPKVMYRLAKLGFTQGYTYFTWRTQKWELEEYLRELTTSPVKDFFRPNFWPNTPDILSDQLTTGLRSTFVTRLILAATMSSNYGMYGPAFELMDREPYPGKEEYVHNEKYEIKQWDLDRPDSLRPLITRMNRIRHTNPALQANDNVRVLRTDNEQLIAFSKATDDGSNIVVTIVNLDPVWRQAGWVELPLQEFGVDLREPFEITDLLSDSRYRWQGPRNYVELNPAAMPAHILRIERHPLPR